MAAFYRVFKNKWITSPKKIGGDYSGKVILVTGGTSGIGEEAAFKYVTLGASKVIITARDNKRGAKTKEKLEARLKGSGSIEVWELDMMSYDSCIAFADRAGHLERLDIAVFNAGVWRSKYHQSKHGWEEDLQVNTLSNTLLAILLLPQLRQTKQQHGNTPVLEFVNSGLHQSAVVSDSIRQEANILAHFNKKEQFGEGKQYKFSKVFLMYVAQRLAEEVSSEQVIITSVCPGWVHTDLARDHTFPGIWILLSFFVFLFMKTPAQGADALLSGVAQGESAHGRFWKDDQIQPLPPSLKGDTMKQVGSRVFEEVIEALEKDVPHVRKALAAALAKK